MGGTAQHRESGDRAQRVRYETKHAAVCMQAQHQQAKSSVRLTGRGRVASNPVVHDRMLQERATPVERSRAARATSRTSVNGRHAGHLEEITFESNRLQLVGSADISIAQPVSRRWSLAAKRAFDIVAALIGLILVLPLLVVLSVLICLESAGPPLFRHQRVGLGGRRFGCLKLRTMRPDAEDQLRADPALYDEYRQHHFKIPEDRDPRTTRIGRWLRRTSLDELPQLWNVFVGDMSLVGPRPVVAEELALYHGSRTLLLSMRPGITGAWAVSGRNCIGYPERCEVELRYVREWNTWMDARILLATVSTVLRPTSRSFRALPDQRSSRVDDVLHREPELLVDALVGRARPEARQSDDDAIRADPAIPRHGMGGFDRDAWNAVE